MTVDPLRQAQHKRCPMSAHDSGQAAGRSAHPPEDAREEPRTPTWLTLLGIALFFLALVAFMATRPAGKTTEELAGEARANAPSPEAGAAAEQAPGDPHEEPHEGH
jgi:hypothetical protein